MRATLKDLIARDNVDIEFVMKGTPPAEYPSGSNAYQVTLRRNGKEITTPYYTGPLNTDDPDALTILECLLLDASCGAMAFNEYCSEFGLDDNIQTYYATWEACKAMNATLREFLGDDFDTYLYAEH